MKTRNYISIEYQNKISIPKLTLKPLNKYFFPHKTFSNGDYRNKKILNLKTSFGSTFSHFNGNKFKTIYQDKSTQISNRNTYYKTNSFSPKSTKSVFWQHKLIKEKNKRNTINFSKNFTCSLKNIKFDNNKNFNNIKNNTKYIFIGNKKPQNKKEIKKENKILNNEILGKSLKNNHKNNSKIKDFINKNNINTKLDFIFYPQNTLQTREKEYEKEKSNQKINKRIKILINKPEETSKNNKIIQKKNEESNELITDYNNYDSYETDINNKLLTSTSDISKKKIIVHLKNINTLERHDKDIQDLEDFILKENNINNNHNDKIPKKNYALDADFDMYDPLTLESNKNLVKDFLFHRKKAKIELEKLIKNEKFNDAVSLLNNKEEDKTEEDNEQNKKNILNHISKRRSVKQLSLKRLNDLNNFINVNDLKPSDYIKYIANKIMKDLDSFRNKKYSDDLLDKIIDNNFSEYMNNLEMKDSYKDNISMQEYLYKNSSNNFRKKRIFFSQKRLNIKNIENSKDNYFNDIMRNNLIANALKNNENDNLILNLNNIYAINNLNSNMLKSNDITTEISIKNNLINNSQSNKSNFIKNQNNKSFNKKDEINLKDIKDNKNIKKKIKSNISEKKYKQKNKRKSKNMMMDKKEGENIINENIIDDSKNEKKQFPEDINEQKPDDKNEINYKEEEEENKDNFEYIKSEFEKSKRNSLIKRKNKQKLSFYNKKTNFFTRKEEKKETKKQKLQKKKNLLDELYEFNENETAEDHIILDEIDKISIESELKEKLKTNMKQAFTLLQKEPKKKDDYIKLNICKKRIKYIIRKLAEKDIQKNLVHKNSDDQFFPKSIEERKSLYKIMRMVQNKIIEELNNNYEDYEESSSSSEKEKEKEENLDFKIYEMLPIDEEEKEEEKEQKIKISDESQSPKKELIYDNLYLYSNDEVDNKNIEIKKEVLDILNQNKNDENNEDNEQSNQNDVHIPMTSNKFFLKKRKFKKNKKLTTFKRLKSEIVTKKKEKKKINLDEKMNNFFEKIKQLKEENINEIDYDKILSELMARQNDNYLEDNLVKEIRLINFYNYFQNNRKMDIYQKKFVRNKYIYSSPLNFFKSKS